jgi:hypothetical protein
LKKDAKKVTRGEFEKESDKLFKEQIGFVDMDSSIINYADVDENIKQAY